MLVRRFTAIALVAVPLLLASGAAPAIAQEAGKAAATDGTIILKPQYKKGDQHKFVWHIERTLTFSAMNQTGSDKSVIDAGLTLVVADVSESGYALDVTLNTIKVENETQNAKTAFDSSKPEDDKDRDSEAFLAFKPLVGMKLTLTADKTGLITGVTGEPAVPQGRRLADVAKQFFITPDYLTFRWNTILNARRDGAAMNVGDTWKQTDTFLAAQVGKFEHIVTNTLKSVKDGAAIVDGVGDMKISPAKEGAPTAFEIKDTNILITSTWDVKDGLQRTIDMQRAFTLDGSAQGMPVKRKLEEKLAVKREQ